MARLTTFLLAASGALSATAAADVTFPAVVEVDSIFPRNETYAPTAVFPIIFAIQNFAAASSLGPIDITWAIQKFPWDQNDPFGGMQPLNATNSTNPYYINLWTEKLGGADAAGTYFFYWQFNYYECLGDDEDVAGTILGSRSGNFTFTIDPTAQQPNLQLVADSDACPAQNATIVITKTWPIKDQPDRNVCGVVPNGRRGVRVDANPCAAKLDSAAVSSIAAAVTASACAASPPALTSGCQAAPTGTTKDNAGSRGLSPMWSGLGMVTAPVLAGLLVSVV
jgi:hypothetical protein